LGLERTDIDRRKIPAAFRSDFLKGRLHVVWVRLHVVDCPLSHIRMRLQVIHNLLNGLCRHVSVSFAMLRLPSVDSQDFPRQTATIRLYGYRAHARNDIERGWPRLSFVHVHYARPATSRTLD